jgi:hypothetical protein
MGRPIGKKTSINKYEVKYLDTTEVNPQWHRYECTTYGDICKKLEENHHVKFSRNIICNIALNRRDKKNHYPNIKITKI